MTYDKLLIKTLKCVKFSTMISGWQRQNYDCNKKKCVNGRWTGIVFFESAALVPWVAGALETSYISGTWKTPA